MAEVKKPPGIDPGTNLSAKYAQAAATKRNRIKLRIPMMTSRVLLNGISSTSPQIIEQSLFGQQSRIDCYDGMQSI
jgi:hypothetical protein